MLVLGILIITPCPKSQDAKVDAPAYIDVGSLWPPPHSEILMGCYAKRYIASPITFFPSNAAISVKILTLPILDLEKIQQSDEKDYAPFYERVSLYIDNKILTITSVSEGGGIGYGDESGNNFFPDLAAGYTFGASVFLWPGDHTARIEIITLSEQILKFEWDFTIK